MEYWSDGVLEAREGIKAPTKEGMETLENINKLN